MHDAAFQQAGSRLKKSLLSLRFDNACKEEVDSYTQYTLALAKAQLNKQNNLSKNCIMLFNAVLLSAGAGLAVVGLFALVGLGLEIGWLGLGVGAVLAITPRLIKARAEEVIAGNASALRVYGGLALIPASIAFIPLGYVSAPIFLLAGVIMASHPASNGGLLKKLKARSLLADQATWCSIPAHKKETVVRNFAEFILASKNTSYAQSK